MKRRMKISDALEIRHSCRAFKNVPMKDEEKAKLEEAIHRCNAMSGLHIQLITENTAAFKGLFKSYGMLSNVRNYIALVGKDNNLSREKSGYYGEKLVLLATGMGLGTCWVGGTFDKNSCEFKAESGEVLHIVIAIGEANRQKTLREKAIFAATHIRSRGRKKVARVLDDAPPWFLTGVNAVLKAPSAANRRPVTISCSDGEVTAHVSGKNDYEYIDLGIAKLHFEIGALGGTWEWGNNGVFTK